ncbi:MAG: glycosyltransferase family 87 protein [Candidatus Hodarchaeota archaeon]
MKLFKRKEIDITLLSKGFLIISLIIHLVFIFSLVFGFLNPLFHDSTYRLGQGSDFYAIYQAGYNVLFGLNPYKKVDGYNVVPYSYNFIYHPFLAFTFGVAFNIFPPFVAYWVWVIVLLSLVWISCYLTHNICRALDKPKWVEFVAIGMWLCFSPIYVELFMGQITLIVALLAFFSLYAETRKKEAQGTIFWTLSCLIKQFPFILLPSILSSGRTRKVVINIIVFTIATIVFGLGYFLFYYLEYAGIRSSKVYTHYGNFDLRSVIYEFGTLITTSPSWLEKNIFLINIVLFSIFIGLSLIATIYSRDYLVSISLFVCSYFIIFSGVWEHHFTLILPFLILLWIRDESRNKWFFIFLFLAIPTPFIILELSNLWYFPFSLLYRCFKFVPILIMFILLLKQAYKTPRTTSFVESIKEVKNNIIIGLKNPNIENYSNIFMEL